VLHKLNFLADEVLKSMLGDTDDDGLAIEALMADTKLAISGNVPKTIRRLGASGPRAKDFTQLTDADTAVNLAHFIAGRMGFMGSTAAEKVLTGIGYGLTYSGFRKLEAHVDTVCLERMRQAGQLSLTGAGLPLEELGALSLAERKVLAIEEFFPAIAPQPADPAAWTNTLIGYLKRLLDRARGVD
jgi:hypothetical protein